MPRTIEEFKHRYDELYKEMIQQMMSEGFTLNNEVLEYLYNYNSDRNYDILQYLESRRQVNEEVVQQTEFSLFSIEELEDDPELNQELSRMNTANNKRNNDEKPESKDFKQPNNKKQRRL